MAQHKSFFKGLNGLRFFAALLVVLTHTESLRQKQGLPNLRDYTIFNNGGLAVQFFFVLSGFLITFLLLQEQDRTGTIHIRGFYMRRILRIWPLYYLLMCIGLFVIPMVIAPLLKLPFTPLPFSTGEGFLMYAFFLPNLASALYPPNLLYPLWSIGVEEQFYLFWAPVVKYLRKHLLWIFGSIIVAKTLIHIYMTQAVPESWITHFVDTLQFECMAVGGLGAWYVHREGSMIKTTFFFNKFYQMLSVGLLYALLFFHKSLMAVDHPYALIYQFVYNPMWATLPTSILFLYFILNVSLNPDAILKTENKVFHFLGEISYGLYMYHILIVFGVIALTKKWLMGVDVFLASIILYGLILSILIVVSYFSYHFFEKKILKLKIKYEY
jgi:peptidoglycan/LPS O-acetylase OafA/YrhL